MVFSVRLSHLFSCDQAALRMAISVCLSVCLWHLFDNVPIIVSSWNFQELLPVTKFGYLLYWDIMGAPRHIPGQALFCVNIGNGWNSVCNNCFNYSNLCWVKLWVIWINSEFEFKYIRLIRRWDLLRSSFRVLATGWVSPTVLRERSLEGKTHVHSYEQYQSFSVNYRQYCHFRFDIFALIIDIIRVKYVGL